jgi:hypothetical protein
MGSYGVFPRMVNTRNAGEPEVLCPMGLSLSLPLSLSLSLSQGLRGSGNTFWVSIHLVDGHAVTLGFAPQP